MDVMCDKMNPYTKKTILKKLYDAYPKELNLHDFDISENTPCRQDFLYQLVELKKEGTIDAIIITSRQVPGNVPIAARKMELLQAGKELVESPQSNKNKPANYAQEETNDYIWHHSAIGKLGIGIAVTVLGGIALILIVRNFL